MGNSAREKEKKLQNSLEYVLILVFVLCPKTCSNVISDATNDDKFYRSYDKHED